VCRIDDKYHRGSVNRWQCLRLSILCDFYCSKISVPQSDSEHILVGGVVSKFENRFQHITAVLDTLFDDIVS